MKFLSVLVLSFLLLHGVVVAADNSDEDDSSTEEVHRYYESDNEEQNKSETKKEETKKVVETENESTNFIIERPKSEKTVIIEEPTYHEEKVVTVKEKPQPRSKFVITKEVVVKNEEVAPFGANVEGNEKYHPDRHVAPVFAKRPKMIEAPAPKFKLAPKRIIVTPKKQPKVIYHPRPQTITVTPKVTRVPVVIRQPPRVITRKIEAPPRFVPQYISRPPPRRPQVYNLEVTQPIVQVPIRAPPPPRPQTVVAVTPTIQRPVLQEQSFEYEQSVDFSSDTEGRTNQRFVQPQYVQSSANFGFQPADSTRYPVQNFEYPTQTFGTNSQGFQTGGQGTQFGFSNAVDSYPAGSSVYSNFVNGNNYFTPNF